MVTAQFELMQRISVFGAMSADAMDFVLQHAITATRAQGEFFFREGDQAQSLYILESGRVAVLKQWRDQEYLLRYLEPGECFGEMALMDMSPRSATTLAVDDSSAFKIESSTILALYRHNLEQFTLLQMNLGREVSRRLRDADDRLFRLSVSTKIERGDRIIPTYAPWKDSKQSTCTDTKRQTENN
jgi:CRP-like cAMP-binding protein